MPVRLGACLPLQPVGRDGRPDQERDAVDLQKEAALAAQLGFDAEYVDAVPLVNQPGVRFDNQAKFHPRKYLIALLRLLCGGKGCQVFEHTNVEEIEGTPITATTSDGARIHCEHVLVATHVPLQGKAGLVPATVLQSKLAPYSSYVVGGWAPRGVVPEALYWDTGDPYDYVRIDRRHDHDFVIFGGEDHKTGQVEDTLQRFTGSNSASSICCRRSRSRIGGPGRSSKRTTACRTSGETAERQYAATGFGGNGMTFGTLSAMMFADYVAEQPNPWAELFDTGRTKIKGGLWNYLKENKDYPYYLIRDRFAGTGGRSLRSIRRGHGEVVDIDGQAAAVYRGLDGEIHVRSAVCTHMGCYVRFNDAEHTWDCPCHGSRFKVNGEVLAGPAEEPLAPIEVTQKDSARG